MAAVSECKSAVTMVAVPVATRVSAYICVCVRAQVHWFKSSTFVPEPPDNTNRPLIPISEMEYHLCFLN